jgi:hypothetical protein
MSGKLTKIWDLPMMLATLLGIVLLFASGVSFGAWPWYFVAGTDAFFIAPFAVVGYRSSKGKHGFEEVYDERAARNTMCAARNAFLAALVAIGALPIVLVLLYGTGEMKTMLMLPVCVTLCVLLILVQALSYAYYTDRDLM